LCDLAIYVFDLCCLWIARSTKY